MSNIILFNLMTVDGFFEGPNREIDWHNVDDEFNDFAWVSPFTDTNKYLK